MVRGKYICQSQSLRNLFMDKPDFNKLSSMHFYSCKRLKNWYLLFMKSTIAQAQQFTEP